MESRLIYESNKIYIDKIIWNIFRNDSEWIFLGIDKETDEKKLQKIINENFHEESLYFVTTRNDSVQISKKDISKKIAENFRNIDIFIWNESFKKAIEFNKNEVFRIGNRFL
ncbi:hypothetical protein OF897_04000 [Chryseobacterium formosus]|uniref:Uncharacterized protein n=1 Tax=Chryseobacterium formosus TaxID=1537363 RepID=A0ABT3XLS4_9FLAO|nr:hypothetical protein [Chryseobacterium formosus]MCX8523083.1 hypothetical protein [Chryseobacterium formosus]